MSQIAITNRTLDTLKPSIMLFFLRNSTLKGFGVKVNPTGTVKFIVEVWHKGRSIRKTLGEYPIMDLQQARVEALSYMSLVKSGHLLTEVKQGNIWRQTHIFAGIKNDENPFCPDELCIADELIESNPVQVLWLKRIDRSIWKREN